VRDFLKMIPHTIPALTGSLCANPDSRGTLSRRLHGTRGPLLGRDGRGPEEEKKRKRWSTCLPSGKEIITVG